MSDWSELRLSVENELREADGLNGLFKDYTRQIEGLLPLFRARDAEVLRKAAERVAQETGNPIDTNAKLLRRLADKAEKGEEW